MTRLKTKSTHGGIVGKANTKQGTSLGQKIYKVHDKNTLWRLTTTCLQHFGYPQRCSTSWAFTCRFQMTIFVPLRSNGLLHLPLGIQFTAPLPDKAEESSPILVVGWLMQLSRLAQAVTCSHRRSKYNESRNLEDLSIEKTAMHTVPQCPSESCRIARATRSKVPNVREFNLKLTQHFHKVFTDSKVANTIRWARKLLDAVC